MSDTPRTDEVLKPLIAKGVTCTGEEALLNFTRGLERELATSNKLLLDDHQLIDALSGDGDGAFHDIEKFTKDLLEKIKNHLERGRE